MADTLTRLRARGIARAKRDRSSIAKGKPSKWHKRVGSTVADMNRLIKVLEKESHKSDARTRVGGGAPGSFVAGGLARSPKGR